MKPCTSLFNGIIHKGACSTSQIFSCLEIDSKNQLHLEKPAKRIKLKLIPSSHVLAQQSTSHIFGHCSLKMKKRKKEKKRQFNINNYFFLLIPLNNQTKLDQTK